MSFNASVNSNGRRTSNLGQVVEILIDEDGDIIDYTFAYPALQPDRSNGESVHYTIYYQRPENDDRSHFGNKLFKSADDAENFLLDQVFEDSRIPFKVFKNYHAYQLTS